MNHARHLFLHKSEWERIKRSDSINQNIDVSREAYFKALDDKSKSWVKNWPDCKQGIEYHVNKRNAELEEKERKVLVSYTSGKKEIEKLILEDRAEAIKRAKDLIFEDSSLGRQLISALRESKAIEERDAQIEFRDKLKARDNSYQKEDKPEGISILTDETRERNKVKETKHKIRQIALFNKGMQIIKKEKDAKRKEKERVETEHTDVINKLLKEEFERTTKKCFDKKEIDDFNTQQKQIKELRTAREMYEDKIIELWRQYHDKVKSKEKIIFDKMHKERYNTKDSIKLNDLLEKIQNEEKRKYDDFIETGIRKSLKQVKQREDEDMILESIKRQRRREIDDENIKRKNWQPKLTNYKTCTESVANNNKEPKNNHVLKKGMPYYSSPFTTQQNKLLQGLKEREKEPSPWSGSEAAHAQFFRYANETMRQCRYKTNICKVIDDYLKENNLGPDYVQND